MALVREHKAIYSVESICAGLGVARASYYRRERRDLVPVTERVHPRSLSVNERQEVLGIVNSERFGTRRRGRFMPRY